MKIIVDELPKDKYECFWSVWSPVFLTMKKSKKSDEYLCTLTNMACNFEYDSEECHGLKKDKK